MSLLPALAIGAHSALAPFSSVILLVISSSLAIVAVIVRPRYALYAVMGATVMVGIALGALKDHHARTVIITAGALDGGARLVCDMTVVSDVVRTSTGARVDGDLIGCRVPGASSMQPARGRVRLFAYGGLSSLPMDATIRVRANYKWPVDVHNGGGFSWRDYLAQDDIGAVASLTGPEWIVVLAAPEGAHARHFLRDMRERLSGAIDAGGDVDSASVLKAMISGDQSTIPDNVREAFQRTGLSHLLSISGLHVGYIALFIYLVVKLVLGRIPSLLVRVPLQKCAAFVTLPCIWGFIAMVGAPVAAKGAIWG